MAIKIALDKTFPEIETQAKSIIFDGLSFAQRPLMKKVYEDKIQKILLYSNIPSDEEQGIIEDLKANGIPARTVSE